MSKLDNKIVEIDGINFQLVPVYFERVGGWTEVSLAENWSSYQQTGYILKPILKANEEQR